MEKALAANGGRPFQRSGLELRCAVLHPGKPFSILFAKPLSIAGILALAGPKAGTLRLTFASGQQREVLTYDGYSYYERMYPVVFSPVVTDRIVLEQLPQVPDIALMKGEKDSGPRIGHVGVLFVAEDSPHLTGMAI